MKRTDSLPLVVGLAGTRITEDDRAMLERVRPIGVILFAHNIETTDQIRELVADLDDLEPRPFVTVDLEGGMVNRLKSLWGDLPAPAAAAAAGRRAVRVLGEAAGAACRSLGIQLDLAPAVDLDCPEACLSAQERCLGCDPERVVVLARVFNEGLEAWGVSGCSKHFPGLGPVPVDTHEDLPILDTTDTELAQQVSVFEELGTDFPAVMVAHVIVPGLGDAERPASLSRTVVERAANLPGSPVVLADDLEMGALDNWGDLPDRAIAALHARNHGLLVCKAHDRIDDIATHLRETAEADSAVAGRLTEMNARMGTLARDLQQRAAAVPAPDDETVAQLWEKARREAG
ncbi:MAG: glycoside hydrolase family 3 N-terminal domain-containing protein [Holophagae bacterium]|jgi:beta-N-acetylhexosaminidase